MGRLIEGRSFYKEPWYNSYRSMIGRCYRQKSANYSNYGGRGISVCDEWNRSFDTFREWAIKNGYSENLTIDRIDTNGNYEPSNCRWATPKEQGNNKRNNLKIFADEKTYSPSEYAKEHGVSYEKARKLAKELPQDSEV